MGLRLDEVFPTQCAGTVFCSSLGNTLPIVSPPSEEALETAA